jgi:hypothetical protein
MNKELTKKIIEKINNLDYDNYNKNIADEEASVMVDDKVYIFDEVDDFESEWVDDGKYSYKTNVAELSIYDAKRNKYTPTGIILSQNISRSGSYFSYYNYDYCNVVQVFRKEITIPEHIEVEYVENN